MKKIFSTILLGIGLLTVNTGCTDWLDIRPESETVLEDFWQNESHATQMLSTCYRSVITDDVMSRLMMWGEIRSDNVVAGDVGSDDYDMTQIFNVEITPSNGWTSWAPLYTTINYCNTFLHYAPMVVERDPNFTEAKLNQMSAEVLAIRSLMYFYLARTFIDCPYVTEASIDDTQDYMADQSPQDSIVSFIKEDLATALTYAREKFDVADYNKGRVTKNMIRALLADIALWEEDYAKCVSYCDDILSDETLELVEGEDVLTDVFYRGNSTESIFELQFDNDVQFNNMVSSYYGSAGDPLGKWRFPSILMTSSSSSPFLQSINGSIEGEEDLRAKDFLYNTTGSEFYWIFKYAGVSREESLTTGASSYAYRSTTANWIVYRLSDIMLMKAEALVQLEGHEAEVMQLVNTTFLRSNPDLESDSLLLSNYSSKALLSNLVLRERQRELMFEGKRWFDLLRLARRDNSPSSLVSYVTKKFDGSGNYGAKMSVMNALYLPINQREINVNSKLKQNEFYDTTDDSIEKNN